MPSTIQSSKTPLASADHPVKANFGQFLGRSSVNRTLTIDDLEKAEFMRAILGVRETMSIKYKTEPGAQLITLAFTCPEKTTHHQFWEIPEKNWKKSRGGVQRAQRYSKPNRSRYVSPQDLTGYCALPRSAEYVSKPVVYQYSAPPPPIVFNSINTDKQKLPTRTRCPLAIVPPPVTDTSSTFLTPPTSGPSSPTPVPPSPSDTKEQPQFVFNMGVVNAPMPGSRVIVKKISDSDEGFIVCEDKDFQPKKTKIFTSEELQKQSILVEEWKKKIQEAL
ncbi:hypothetical protein GCK72_003321 [Caenorhabditis remanei]|uniref:Uncharacterized protein n=1 Tax=Caenorhabditis remanei TaxID=31234 RepID=A0A6A5HX50_CAERE|nr:hypothetical protein GCK72_003321 [Caenorhabditis remanei]KAF1771494.1 hypothetical protein GCK72_003321 [Caenorhabditis remanei]